MAREASQGELMNLYTPTNGRSVPAKNDSALESLSANCHKYQQLQCRWGKALRVTLTLKLAHKKYEIDCCLGLLFFAAMLVVPFSCNAKYHDDESDLLDYGYRYYNPTHGRWLVRDPIRESGFILLADEDSDENVTVENAIYGFIENEPITKIDALGLWPSSDHFLGVPTGTPLTHQNSNHRAIPGLSSDDYIELDAATLYIDSHQDTTRSFEHAMRAPRQPVDVAKGRANFFVKLHILAAQRYWCQCNPNRREALWEFGQALHAIQDTTSPAHTGFQVWRGTSHWIAALNHVRRESYDPGTGSHLDTATAWLWTFLNCPAPALPADFFTNLGHD